MKLLFLGCNQSQLPYLKYLVSKGIKVIVVDMNTDSVGKNICWKFINSGYDNHEEMIRELETVGFEKTDKIFTASAQFAYLGASKVAEHFGISFPSFNAVEAILDKSIFYKNFSDLEINIPSTRLIKNKKELALALNELKTNCYLKSDRSKNPNYVYKIDLGKSLDHINWKKDKYFANFYILQEEVLGQAIRINFIDNEFLVFNFATEEFDPALTNNLSPSIKKDILKIVNFYGIQNWIVKFDLILGEINNYAFLDIGIDPPMRLRNHINLGGYSFEEIYCQKYVFDEKIQISDYV